MTRPPCAICDDPRWYSGLFADRIDIGHFRVTIVTTAGGHFAWRLVFDPSPSGIAHVLAAGTNDSIECVGGAKHAALQALAGIARDLCGDAALASLMRAR
jgi:hypothetical protein